MFSKFASAQADPFNDNVKGCKIPDSYSFPTSTAQLESEFLIYPDINGNFDFAVLPHPLYSVYCNNVKQTSPLPNPAGTSGTIGGVVGGNAYFFPGCPQSSEGSTVNQVGPSMSGVASYDQLSQQCLSYRVVAMGAKMESLMVPTSATGALTFCHVPCLQEAPLVVTGSTVIKYDASGGVSTDAPNLDIFMGLPLVDTTGFFDPSMRQYATGHSINVVEFQTKGIQSSLRILNDASTQFRAVTEKSPVFTGEDGELGGDQYQGEVVGTVPGGVTQYFPRSFVSIDGWSSFVCRGQGFPTVASTSSAGSPAPVATLRVICLIEYIENPGFSLRADAESYMGFYTSRKNIGSNHGYFRCLEFASKLPFYRSVKLYGSSSYRNSARLGN